MKIAIDIDDCVMDFWRSLEHSVALEYGIELDYESNQDWEDATLKRLDIFGEGRTWWDWLQDRDWVWATFKPVPGAIGAIDMLRRQGHYIELLTKKPDWAEWTVWKWLGRWRPAANRVTVLGLHESKAQVSDAQLLVDDNVDNVLDWVRSGRPAILFDRPWNRSDLPVQLSKVPRAYNWHDVYILAMTEDAERSSLAV